MKLCLKCVCQRTHYGWSGCMPGLVPCLRYRKRATTLCHVIDHKVGSLIHRALMRSQWAGDLDTHCLGTGTTDFEQWSRPECASGPLQCASAHRSNFSRADRDQSVPVGANLAVETYVGFLQTKKSKLSNDFFLKLCVWHHSTRTILSVSTAGALVRATLIVA